MKKINSPLNFIGTAVGTATGALGTQFLGNTLGGMFGRGNIQNRHNMGGGGDTSANLASGIGTRPMGDMATDPAAQWNPAAVQNMQGIFGGVNARQSAVGGGGIFRNTSKYDNVD